MVTLTHRFKHTVAAFLLGVGFSLPSAAQQASVEELLQELLTADSTTYAQIEERILAQWEKSGSAAMDLLLRRGKEALDEGDPETASEHFSALVDHAPDFAEGYYGRANAYYLLDLYGPALDDLRSTLRLNPQHFEAMRGLASILQELERPEDALEVFEMVLAISPHSEETKASVDALKIQLEGQTL